MRSRQASLLLAIAFLLGGLPGYFQSAALAAPAGTDQLASFVYPVLTPRFSSKFGPRKHPVLKYHRHHDGVDLAVPEGTQVRAVSEGKVVFADKYAGYGNLVVVQHEQGLTSHYGHLSVIRVQIGQSVPAGKIIGEVGSTGLASGPHLHFEVRQNGSPLNPEKLIPALKSPAQG